MSDLYDECPDDTYIDNYATMFIDHPCPKCGGDVGHLINCPYGSAFSGDMKTIKNNPLGKGGKDG